MEPAYKYTDGTGFGYPWELIPLGDFTLRTKDGAINGYKAEFQMVVNSCSPCHTKNALHAVPKGLVLNVALITGLGCIATYLPETTCK